MKTKNNCNHSRIKKNYPLYKTIDANVVMDIVNYSAEHHGFKQAFQIPVPGKDDIFKTYKEFADEIEGFGTFLLSKGLKKDRIAILGENSYEWLIAYFSILGGGNTAVPLDRDLPVEDLLYNVKNSGCKAIVFRRISSYGNK